MKITLRVTLGLLIALLFNGCSPNYRLLNRPFPFESTARGDHFERRSSEHRIQVSGVLRDPDELVLLKGGEITDTLLDIGLADTFSIKSSDTITSLTISYDPTASLSYQYGYHFSEYIAMGAAVNIYYYTNNDKWVEKERLKRVDGTIGYWFSFGGSLPWYKKLSVEYRNGHFLSGASLFEREFFVVLKSGGETSRGLDSTFTYKDNNYYHNMEFLIEHSFAIQFRPIDRFGIFGGFAFNHALFGELEEDLYREALKTNQFYGGVSLYVNSGIISLQGAYLDYYPTLSLSYTFTKASSNKDRGVKYE